MRGAPAARPALLLGLLVLGGCAGGAFVRPGGAERVTVFGYRGAADGVALRGDMTGWQAAPLSRLGRDWTLALPLPPGRYEYRLEVRRGAATAPALPPGSELADDGFGGENAVLRVGP